VNFLINEEAFDERIRQIAREEAARPAFVTQRSISEVIGIDRREFLRLCRIGAFPSTRERRLAVARTGDVLAYFDGRLGTPKAADQSSAEFARSRSGLRRVAP
jgi:hypothetical protein